MEISGVEKRVSVDNEDVEVKINIVFLISKFMKEFNYKFKEVLDLNWFIFNDLMDGLKGVEIESDTRELDLHLSKVVIDKSKAPQDTYEKIIDGKKTQLRPYTFFDTSAKDMKEMEKIMLGRG